MNWLRRQLMRLSATATPPVIADPSSRSGTVFIARTPETFTYDADGNMTSDGRFHYLWNGENRLICASNAEVVVTYAYDHRGRMVCKEISHRDTEPQRIEGLLKTFRVSKDVDCREALRIIEEAHGFGFTNFSLFFNENLPD